MSAQGFGYYPLPNIPLPPPTPQGQATFNPFITSNFETQAPGFGQYQPPQPPQPSQPPFSSGRSQSPNGTRSNKPRNGRAKPSKASGGVPDPSALYLVHASLPPLLLPHPRKILVVIDLNGTLLYRPNRKNPSHFIERPHARRFLSYCIETFTVAIWSSAKPDNVRKMCAQLMTPEQHQKVVAIWGRDKFGLSSSDYNLRVQCYKRLTTLWNAPEVASSHPNYANGGRWNQADTVLVDDSIEKGRSEPYNIIPLPEFKGDANEDGFILPQVHDYINNCASQADISTYIRVSPFQPNANFKLG